MTPCPYPDCQDERAHPRPHLIEAAAIERRVAAAVATERARLRDGLAELVAGPDFMVGIPEYAEILILIDPPSHRCNCPESGTSGSCPFHDNGTIR